MRLLGFLRRGSAASSLTAEDLEALSQATSPDEVSAIAVDWCARVVHPLACYGYLWSDVDRQFRLTSMAAVAGADRPEHSYSGLMASAGEAVQAPLVVQPEEVPPQLEVTTRAGETWLVVPCGTTLVIRARLPRNRTPDGATLDEIRSFARIVGPVAAMSHRLAAAEEEVERLKGSLVASHVSSESMMKPERSLEALFRLPIELVGAAHGALVTVDGTTGRLAVTGEYGRGAALANQIIRGEVPELLELPAFPDIVPAEQLGIFRDRGIKAVVRIPIILEETPGGCGYYFLEDERELSPYRFAVLATLGNRFSQVLKSAQFMSQSAFQYLDTLRAMVTAMDLMAPHSVGHCDRMARYARMLAQELGLPAPEVESIALGAYLHDVGMVALDLDLINTGARLTPDQYERVKQHALLGSELVAVVRSAVPVAPMVAHHHERWDGHGYPHRLKGQEIPLGARIISVCDLFEAKTTSRGSRKALPFLEALQALEGAAGTQLDPELVPVFIRAWRKLRAVAAPGRPPAPCWVMRQVPGSICETCPNRAFREPVPCWENAAHLCSRHGDDCASCAVYTETLSRAVGGIDRVPS